MREDLASSGHRKMAARFAAELLCSMNFPGLSIDVDVAGFFLCVDDLNLVDNAPIVFSHIDFDRLAWHLLLSSLEGVNHADGGFFTQCLFRFEECPRGDNA